MSCHASLFFSLLEFPPTCHREGMLRTSNFSSDQTLTSVVGMLWFMSDLNQSSLPAPFYSVLVSTSVFMALSTVFHSLNAPTTLCFLTLFFWSYFCHIGPFSRIHLLIKVSLGPDITLCDLTGLKAHLSDYTSHTNTMLPPTRKSVPRSSRQSDHTKTS